MKFSSNRRGLVKTLFLILLCVSSGLFILKNDVLQSFQDQNCFRCEIKAKVSGPLDSDDVRLLRYIRENFLEEPSKKPYNITQSKNRHRKKLTWKFINDIIVRLFDDEPPGFFIEAGALDGVLLSNSLWLEVEKGWSGLLIEPEPTNYKSLLTVNRKAWTSNACLSTVPYPKITTFIGFNPVSENDIEDGDTLNWFLRSQSFKYEKNLIFGLGDRPIMNPIQCFPLESYVLALNITNVDFLSLDVQGGEWEILKMWPWDKLTVRSLVVEYLPNNIGKLDPAFIEYMTQRGYRLVGTSNVPDYFFVLQSDNLSNKNITSNDDTMYNRTLSEILQ